MAVGEIFPAATPPLISFDFTDVIANVGYILYDGYATTNNSTKDYFLIPALGNDFVYKVDSDEDTDIIGGTLGAIYSEWDTNGTTAQNFDFDLAAYPQAITIEGDVFVRFCLVGDQAGGVDCANLVVTTRVRKWDGTTETEIASDARSAFTLTNGKRANFVTKIPVSTTVFKKGEQLRISLECTYNDPATSGSYVGLGHSPNDAAISPVNTKDFIAGTSRFVVAVPYKLPT